MTPHLPITPDDIARESIAAAEAGASVIHLHARNPSDGSPTPDPNVFMQFLPRIKQNTDAVINITTGGSLGMSMEDRLAAPLRAKPELCSLNMGSMNFGLYHVTEKFSTWKYDWERAYIAKTKDIIVSNTFAQIERFIRELGQGCGTRFECECYDVGHLYTLANFVDQKLLEPPLFVQTIFGIMGGIAPTPTTSCTCGAPPTVSSARLPVVDPGRQPQIKLPPSAPAWRQRPRRPEDSVYLGPGRLPRATPNRSPRSARSSRSCRWRWPRRRRHAPC
jgi:uncharacterized protein (DUF849 family)